jgi:hypothetical protein
MAMGTGRRGLTQVKGPLQRVVERGLLLHGVVPAARLACGHTVVDVHHNRSRRMRCDHCRQEQNAASAEGGTPDVEHEEQQAGSGGGWR